MVSVISPQVPKESKYSQPMALPPCLTVLRSLVDRQEFILDFCVPFGEQLFFTLEISQGCFFFARFPSDKSLNL